MVGLPDRVVLRNLRKMNATFFRMRENRNKCEPFGSNK
jgi:hypothetical protein